MTLPIPERDEKPTGPGCSPALLVVLLFSLLVWLGVVAATAWVWSVFS